jgi:hypothetical protein
MNEFKDNVGGWCKFLILEGKLNNKEIIDFVRKKFNSRTSVSSIAWYRNKLREEGLINSARKSEVLSIEKMREMMEE